MKRNVHLAQLQGNYLFPEVQLKKENYLKQNPGVSLISLGVGDTTQPLTGSITRALTQASLGLGTEVGYSGYGPEQGKKELRKKIAQTIFKEKFSWEEIFISDGANGDLSRLQLLFGSDISIAVQNPTYPVYLEGSLIQGVKEIHLMNCHPENDFFPDLKKLQRTDIIYFCSPNNPTGAVATKKQLEELVDFAHKNRSIIVFDAAYCAYIQDPTLPKSIYEIERAKEVAIEVSSFSKSAGFTGVRLGWTVVPKELRYECGHFVLKDWNRLVTTVFNGASNIAQIGGCAALEPEGITEIKGVVNYYLENAKLIKEAMQALGYEVFGGVNAPYLWVRWKGKKSWELFHYFLENKKVVTIPGCGFGSQGEGFIRLSAFGNRQQVLTAIERISCQ